MRATLFFCLFLVSACSFSAKKEEEEKPVVADTKPRLVGRIASVPSEGDFVLIESYGPWRIGEGGLLTSVGTDGRTANLLVTGEKLRQHAAADIRSGVANVGDSVYSRPVEDQKDPSESVESPAPNGEIKETEVKKSPGKGGLNP